MRRPRRPPFGPIRVPAGAAGDAFIDLMCKLWGVTREEAREAGRKAMRTVLHMSPIIPRPMKAPIGALMFMKPDGTVDEEAVEHAKASSEVDYTRHCLGIAQTILEAEDPEVVKEVSSRHYYATRYVLELAQSWIDMTLEREPSLDDRLAGDIKWAIKTVIDDANKDLHKFRHTEPLRRKMAELRRERDAARQSGEESEPPTRR